MKKAIFPMTEVAKTRGILRALGIVPYPDKIPVVQNLRAVSFLAYGMNPSASGMD
ncbi:MAG: hypothetical protein LBU11_09970 [Zoogloeaceae bacterium]|jgi:hypothetical protein|nr:hypothetical protein [Zoogloeaceae bacterium]